MSFAKRSDQRTNRFRSWVGGVFGDFHASHGINKKKSIAKFNFRRQRNSYSSDDSGLDGEDSSSHAGSISYAMERTKSPSIYNNEAYFKDGNVTMNAAGQPTAFAVDKLKDEPSCEKLVEYVVRADEADEDEFVQSPTEIYPLEKCPVFSNRVRCF
ncbi:hypothetical protein DSO57_1007517 [Entomophthora muscae]|uniref:Uncharacterized protein n=1 Tax=Entomophthora muscae TaxID=34485 RepID=A0ACC2UH35_9FUNG|nr:hypothetical protein DSO57_1007517 [Entomophthora muscae]